MQNWHAKSREEIFKELKTSPSGLSKREAEERLQKYGSNELVKKKKKSSVLAFLKQFNSPLVYILFVAMIISFIFNHLIDAYVILAVVIINAAIGFFQEKKAEKAIDALKKIIVSHAKVYRDKTILKIPTEKIVPGDIILLEEGDRVPADARLISIKDFRTQESSLTGESFPADKDLRVLDKEIGLGDQENMVFMGTHVVSGSAKALVVSTGGKTAIGQVAESIQEVQQPQMHFQEKVSQLAMHMAIFAAVGAGLTFIIGYFFNKLEFFDIFLFTIASLVSGIPEGLPAVLTIVLAVGARRMAKRNAVIRHLPAVETLGVTTVIVTDKTGTLTQNSMAVEKIITSDSREINITGDGWTPIGKFFQNKKPFNPSKDSLLRKILEISSLCNKGNLLRKDNGEYGIVGDPTEVALLVMAKKAGLDRRELAHKIKILDDFSFKSEVKFRASLLQDKRKKELYSIGAFESILAKSAYFIERDKKVKLTGIKTKEFLFKAEGLAKKGLRVLAIAYKDMPAPSKKISKGHVNNLIFLGLVGMKDPPRKGVKDSIKKARHASIRIIMQTGDHKQTAIAIAKEIGLVDKGNKSIALTEQELEKLSEEEFSEAVKKINIFARVTPKMKMKIVKELQSQGEIVTMTGDGVNDAPALKAADIGVSMGIIGTDVARESSEMILADDHFSSIVNAVEEGRTVFRNVRRTSFFLVSTSVAEDVTIIASLLMMLPLPMLPTHFLYLNLVTGGITDVSLAMEPSHFDVLDKPPKNKKEKILNKQLLPFLSLISGLMALGTIPLFIYFLPQGLEKAQTVAFVSMSMFQLFSVYNLRSLKSSVFKLGIFSNKWVNWGVVFSFLAMLAAVYIPWMEKVFRFVPLKITELLLIALVASSALIFGELYKLGVRKIEKRSKRK